MKRILLIGAALSAATSFGTIRAVSHDMYGNKADAWQLRRHNDKMNVVTNGGAQIVFIGDSITHGWETSGKKQWKKYFSSGAMKALNLGTSADRTEHVLWRITEGKELDGYTAKAIFIMIGTNNTGHFPFEKEPPIDTILGIREILKVVRAKQPTAKIMLMPIFPRGKDFCDVSRRRNSVVNKEIAKFADGQNIFWLDFTDQFMTCDGQLPREIMADLLHPGALGYEIWSAAVLPYARAALAGAPMPPNRYAGRLFAEEHRMTEAITAYPTARADEPWWLDRMLEKRNQIAASDGTFDLVFFGDSITHNWERRVPALEAELRKTYTLLNIGYSGDRTEHLLWRGMNGELDGYTAKCIMLMIGTNNTWHRKDKSNDIAAGIGELLDLIVRKQPQAKVLLLPIFPFGDGPTHPNRVNNDAVNQIIKGYADGERIIWVDFNQKFLDAKGNTVKYMPDHCHPNEAGYREIWLPAVLPYFQKICGK